MALKLKCYTFLAKFHNLAKSLTNPCTNHGSAIMYLLMMIEFRLKRPCIMMGLRIPLVGFQWWHSWFLLVVFEGWHFTETTFTNFLSPFASQERPKVSSSPRDPQGHKRCARIQVVPMIIWFTALSDKEGIFIPNPSPRWKLAFDKTGCLYLSAELVRYFRGKT